MKGKTPFEALRASRMGVSPAIGAMPVLLLDRLSRCTDECLWNVSNIPWDYSPKKLKLVNETMAYYPVKSYEKKRGKLRQADEKIKKIFLHRENLIVQVKLNSNKVPMIMVVAGLGCPYMLS